MNLFQIAERLKGMPQEAVMAYANGMNPEVPPYVALGELNRRNRLSQEAQAQAQAQTPTEDGTIKDQVEQAAASLPMPQQSQQPQPNPQIPPQALQQMLAMAAQGQRQGQPQGQPRPAPNPMGGVASASVPPKMFSAGGGIVAFAEGDEVEDEEALDTEAEAADLLRIGKERLGQKPETAQSPLARRAALIKQYPHLAVLDQPIGQEALKGLQALQAKQAEEDARQQEALKDQRKMEFFKALIASGEASRGQRGIGAVLGGFGKSMAGSEEALSRQEAEIRGRGIKREADMLALRNEIEKMQRARAEGDVQGEIKHGQAAAEMANKLGISQNALLRGMFQGIMSLRGRERAAEATETAAKTRAAAAGAGGPKTTDFKEKVATLAADYERQGMSPEDAKAKATREVMSTPTLPAAGVRATTADIDRATKEARRRAVLSGAELGTAEYDKKFSEFFAEELQRAQTARAPAATAPTATQTSSTPPAGVLKKGTITTFKNGQQWTLDENNQPKRVK